MIASSVAKSVARSVAKAVSSVGSGGVANPFIITPSTATPVAGVDTTWSTNAGDLGTPVSYSWDFGDGTIPVTGATPSHYFVGLGPYTVTCVVTYDDDSTDTDTQVISPTAPSANGNLTLIESYLFTGPDSINAASPDTFDSYRGNGSAITYKVPVGAKYAAAADAGWSGYSSSFNNLMEWSIGHPVDSGIIHQLGAWVRFESWPASTCVALGAYNVFYDIHGLLVNSSGELLNSYNNGVLATLSLNTWYWLGLGFGGAVSADAVSAKFLVREINGTATQYTTGANDRMYFRPGSAYAVGGGCFNASGNVAFKCRISGLQLFTLSTLASMAYPADLIQPQDENHIYQIDPVSGDDTEDGIYTAWQTVTRANAMMDVPHRGIISVGTDGVVGSGSHLVIDTSAQRFDVEDEGLILATESMKLYPIAGETYIDFKAEVIIDAGDWTVTGGYTGIYETPFVQSATRVWSDDVYHEPVANLAALDAAAAGASVIVANVLYIKPFGSTDPRSDGKVYRAGRIRPDSPGDTVGVPVVAAAAKDLWISGVKAHYLAVNLNGSYAIGDLANSSLRPGFSGSLLVENFDIRRFDKHGICYVQGTTGASIITRNGYLALGLEAALTSYMATGGTGNDHLYENIEIDNQHMVERTSSGVERLYNCWYSHGDGGYRWDQIEIKDCDFGANEGTAEAGNQTVAKWTNTIVGYVNEANTILATGLTMREIPRIINGGSLTASTVTSTGTDATASKTIDGALSITNSTFDLRLFQGGFCNALWDLGASLDLTFTGNTVRFGNAGYPVVSCPVFEGGGSASIVSCNNNTYYIGAADVFAKDFDAGGGAQDYTFAQWQALGYDAASTRIDP